MTSTIVPPVDLAPVMPSRVVEGGVLLTTDTTITVQEAPDVDA